MPWDCSQPVFLSLLICVEAGFIWIFAGALLYTWNIQLLSFRLYNDLFSHFLRNFIETGHPRRALWYALKAVLTQVSCYLTLFISTSYCSLILHYEFCTHSVFSEPEHQLPRTGELCYCCISSSWRKELTEICWLCEHPRIQSLLVA